MKRLFDVLAAAAGLLFVSPVLLVIAVAIRFSSGPPVLFPQTRVGRGRHPFTLWKFRTMTVKPTGDSGCSCGQSRNGNAADATFHAGDTSRITPLGRLLRRTKLDELPQLWNVLVGDMSLVGPRPEIRQWVNAYPERWGRVLTVRPGITDPASIVYRNEEEILARSPEPERTYRDVVLPHKLELYEEYVRTQSFCGDMKILVHTLYAVLFPAGNRKVH